MEQMQNTFYWVELAKTKRTSTSLTYVVYLGDENTGDLMLPGALVLDGQVVSTNQKLDRRENATPKKYPAEQENFNFILNEYFPEKQGIDVKNIIAKAQKRLHRMRKDQVPA